ncbi:MAG: threonine/serine dehydratase [Gemmatimonadetes bacterium]|nr:threonine/serine dehydratase [Gemmatimonadota bacterium]
MKLFPEILEAADRIRPYLRETPLLHSAALSERIGTSVWLKLENLQVTGSFKARGALNKVLGLTEAERHRGVVTASSGNHGAAVANAGRHAGVVPTVFLPTTAAPIKIRKIEQLGARVEFAGDDSGVTEVHARAVAERAGQVYLSPYNDWDVVAGQGTIGIELLAQCPDLGGAVISVGGGGLIGGIASYLKAVRPELVVIGSSPANSCVMVESVRAGRVLDLPSLPTLSDGTAGGVEAGTITYPLCRDLVDDYDLPSEEEIAAAMRLLFDEERLICEGAAAVAVATAIRQRDRFAGRVRDLAIVLCGGNVDAETWCQVMRGDRPGGPPQAKVRKAGSEE